MRDEFTKTVTITLAEYDNLRYDSHLYRRELEEIKAILTDVLRFDGTRGRDEWYSITRRAGSLLDHTLPYLEKKRDA